MKLSSDIPLPLWIDLQDELTDKTLINVLLDHRGNLWLLTEQSSEILAIEASPDFTRTYRFSTPPQNPTFIQPLPENDLLLVNSGSHYHGRGRYDPNGSVYSEEGTLLREILLGDSIESLQTARNGSIWTTYDELGVFGASGELGIADPIGKPGLVQWDSSGHKQYQFQPPGGVEPVFCSYALNVVSDREAWIYYDPLDDIFALVRIVDNQVADYWNCPHAGARQFAIWQEYVALFGSWEDKLIVYVFERGTNHQMQPVASVSLIKQPDWVRARGDAVVIGKNNLAYRITVAELLDNLT